MSNFQINTRVRRLFHYLEDFEKGKIRIPAFQRDFEWDNAKKIKLFDSIKEGYPIGSILFWRPDFQLEDFTNFESDKIGAYALPERSVDFFYILDGYQRLATLFGCLINPNQTHLKRDDSYWKNNFNLIYNLETNVIESVKSIKYKIYEIPLYKFVDGDDFFDFQTELVDLKIEREKVNVYKARYKNFGIKLSTYDIPSIDMIGGTTTQAVDIFTRLNSEGAKIKSDWILSALSFKQSSNFRLGTEIDHLLKELGDWNFDKLPRKTIFQCITNAFGSVFFDQTTQDDIKKLKALAERVDFIEMTRKTMPNIKKAVQFLFESLFVLDSKLLPYNNQLIFITDFFNKTEHPTEKQLSALKKWFWITTYSNYFTIYNLSKQRLAYKVFQDFIQDDNQDPIYYDNDKKSFEILEFPSKIDMGSVRAKALALFMLQYQAKIEALDMNFVKGAKIYSLFSTENSAENTILLIEPQNTATIPKFQKDLSFWLQKENDYKRFFITADVKQALQQPIPIKAALEIRKKLIIEAEQLFVEKLWL